MQIEGVITKKLTKHCDDRGFFAEVLRDDDKLLTNFGQLSWSTTYPGVIKAFHYHEEQDDIWFFPSGNAQVVLYDLRENSSTKGKTNVFYMGENNPMILLIPKGVAHGYRVIGDQSATIIYCTTKSYNPKKPDEKRIPWNDETIGFNWETQNR
ncbi:dTDP-4-dehydrorhamnose 3,5-epimerase family protein [Gottfriedia solisilvae]|uniref:Spore coat polysaccharide biosynthesis protein SpsL n=1 Tax=Gottfriedia solisilvae TaxID=1516104 RepID=A0A8J3ABR3_9BACI|nr:dTDP-4-dehydrorhamnose 3,5-epimerase family protein [Gottfriedia solisilvae]GGI10301.1 spore coat polysaccharide biosynthesis protein SpsL [Gottfriedia solisilvae]